jgi:Phosphatase-1 catalytic subunit binding region
MSNTRRNLISPVNSIPLNIHFNNIIPSNKVNSATSNSTISLPIATIPASSQLTIAKPEAIIDNSAILCNCPMKENTIKDYSSQVGNCTAAGMDLKNCDQVHRTKNDVSMLSNSRIKDIPASVGDTDSDSDEDCLDDFHSENGEIVDSMKWNGDILSPISSPINPPQTTAQQLVEDYDYDSDESDVWDSYDRNDSDEEQRERDLAEQRILDANRRWEENMTREDESAPSYTKKKKKVHFPSTNLASVRPMLTWSHAHRIARKGEWEQLARDSVRFRERIASTASVLAPVFDPKHRANVCKRLHCETK